MICLLAHATLAAMKRLIALSLAACLTPVACASDEPRPTGADAGLLPDAGAPTAVSLPDTPAGRELAWVLAVVNERGGVVEVAELEQHFHESFLSAVPPSALGPILMDLAASAAPLRITSVAPAASPLRSQALLASRVGPLVADIQLDAGSERIAGLLFSPAPDLESGRPDSWQAVEHALSMLATRSSYLVASLEDAACQTRSARAAEQPLAIGSAFKLYVLAEVARQIRAGMLSWDTAVTVRDELDSLPSGALRDVPAGTQLSVRELAEAMISVSDNTATDHLIVLLGRERVEEAFGAAGHAAPELNIPLLTTREAFLLKLELTPMELGDYLARDVAGRREVLAGLEGRVPLLASAAAWSTPLAIEQIEWFASPNDLCAVMAYLFGFGSEPGLEPLLEILALNRGLPISASEFPYVGFKGGSEVGVLNATWIARTVREEVVFLTLGLNDPTQPINEIEAFRIALGMFDLVAAGE